MQRCCHVVVASIRGSNFMCSPNINKSFLKVSTLLILRHIVALGTKTEGSSTQMCSKEIGVITTPLCLLCFTVLVLHVKPGGLSLNSTGAAQSWVRAVLQKCWSFYLLEKEMSRHGACKCGSCGFGSWDYQRLQESPRISCSTWVWNPNVTMWNIQLAFAFSLISRPLASSAKHFLSLLDCKMSHTGTPDYLVCPGIIANDS